MHFNTILQNYVLMFVSITQILQAEIYNTVQLGSVPTIPGYKHVTTYMLLDFSEHAFVSTLYLPAETQNRIELGR